MGKGRKSAAISPSVKIIESIRELQHLDGLSDLHRLDVEANFRLLNMGEKAADDEERALLESYYFGNGRRTDLIANFWFGDAPGAPVKPTILPGADWVEELKAADDRRRNYRDGTRMRNFEEGETSGTMKKIFARLPPWVAVETGQHLTREDLSKSVMKVAREFEMETGLRVLAAVVHRETGHDLHIHLVFSQVVPILIGKVRGKDYAKTLRTKQNKIARANLAEAGIKYSRATRDAEMEKLWEAGLERPDGGQRIEYQKVSRSTAPRRGLRSMGQQYVSKTNLWEASGRDAAVAAVNEKYSGVSFRATVQDAAAVAPDGDPAHKFVDFWLVKRWSEVVSECFPEAVRDKLPEAGREAARRFVEDGTSLLNPTLAAARTRVAEIEAEAAAVAVVIEKTTIQRKKEASVLEVRATSAINRAKDLEASVLQKDYDFRQKTLPIPVAEVAAAMGFEVRPGDPGLRADFEGEGHRLMPAEGGFLHSVWERPRLGAWQWAAEKLVDSGLRLIHAVHPKLSRLGVIERLAEMFPTRLASVVVEILTIKNPVLFKALLGIEDPAGDPPSGAPPAGASMEEPGK